MQREKKKKKYKCEDQRYCYSEMIVNGKRINRISLCFFSYNSPYLSHIQPISQARLLACVCAVSAYLNKKKKIYNINGVSFYEKLLWWVSFMISSLRNMVVACESSSQSGGTSLLAGHIPLIVVSHVFT